MTDFTFQTTPNLRSAAGATEEMGTLFAAMGVRRVGFVTDPGIQALGLADPALASLRAAGLSVEIVDDVVADPPEALVLSAVERLRGVDGIASVGGGSSLDVAKLCAVLLAGKQQIGEIYGVGNISGERLPLILAPTTAGTGSEVTPISIITTGEAQKMGVVSPQLLPDWALLDAALTLSLPREVTAATGVDAMVHAVEAYTSAHRKNPVSDALAREALRLLGANIERACEAPDDLAARQAMLLGSALAGMAFANAPVAAVHALAYPLGGHFHVPHGLSNCLVLPHVLEFNMGAAAAMYAELAPIAFPGAPDLVAGFRALALRIGLKTRLAEVGVGHNHLPMLAEDAMKQTRLLVNNPREVTYDDALAIYSAAL
ncbi:MAG: iron-containing alcohol dehydrogenase [Pseudomonadota bacterium]